MSQANPFDVDRFVKAQDPLFADVERELRDGRKRTHWMWFVFPQLRGLGRSQMAQFYGITSLEEAKAYLAHPVLGPRLVLCTNLVLQASGRPLSQIFGTPDDLKFCSSMTLFALTAGKDATLFEQALQRYCDGKLDEQTVALVEAQRS